MPERPPFEEKDVLLRLPQIDDTYERVFVRHKNGPSGILMYWNVEGQAWRKCLPTLDDVAELLRRHREFRTQQPAADVTPAILASLSWMKDDMDERRKQGDTGLDSDPLSPQMQTVAAIMEDLRAGRIQCRRTP